MTTESRLPEGWTRGERPASLFRRFEFDAYPETRAFVERLAGLSKETGLYPDLSFGKTYVNVTVYASSGENIGAAERKFAARAAELATGEES